MSKSAKRGGRTKPRTWTKEESYKYVGLNVGGKIYRTSRTTLLTRDLGSFFKGLLDFRAGGRDKQGNYLIDRNGDIFRHVLNFLRSGKLLLPARFDAFHLLEQEADFFKLAALKTAVKDKLKLKGSVIGLNVGGKIYRTSESVIRRHGGSFFSQINRTFPKDDEGNYLIDRDGEIFQHVLDFMTSGKLVLPESFDEFALLQQEADFFALETLKQAAEERLEMVGFVINKQVFKLSPKDVLRYFKESMLATYPKDTQGNYVIEGIMEAGDHVVNYIRHGGIVQDITTDQLGLLRKDAEKLQMRDLCVHCESLETMKQHCEARSYSLLVHVYVLPNDPCIAYINKSPSFFWKRRQLGNNPIVMERIHEYSPFFHDMKEIKLGDGKVSISKVALKDGHPTLQDVASFFGPDRVSECGLQSGGSRLIFGNRNA